MTTPYSYKCPVCMADVGSLCRATKAEIVGAINVGDVLVNQVHIGRHLVAREQIKEVK